ncbi:MAG TPA: hypothetical protein VG777_08670, partial [Thermoanaerobaculia bacterium]|nr:hypothetical protein [Thermoanaerobaculia bacterium]
MKSSVPSARPSTAFRKAAVAGLLAAALAAPSRAGVGKWSSLGPEGGLVSALLPDPVSASVVWGGTYGGGLLVSRDAGNHWSRVPTGGLGDVVNDLAAVPGGALLAATDDGILRSDDSGATWQAVNVGLTDSVVYALTVDAGGVIYAGTQSQGVFRSEDGRRWEAAGPAVPVYALAADPTRPGSIRAATGGSGVLTTGDGGRSWAPSPAAIADAFVFDIEIDPGNPS